ncbi:3-phosphoshikimate 1-carboxyvinyltransferase [Sutterella sp.]|uniref:3-phosphoshikimate 1-carboxyvinyltransferase n=1 Tax=Sutterella sp. TaxID=1981025 RepID=UPI0026E0C54F|nr:3-phosphoshikimate 1-carboxyvinyltransferase [Sutterella sp.]MDO5532213.1 3-phosphoshikimate 1-carboxyvinyltransferase [Sutterella sp.]
MDALVTPQPLTGEIPAIASKSYAHRLLIAAALGGKPSTVRFAAASEDIDATCRVLTAMGAKVTRLPGEGATVVPMPSNAADRPLLPTLDCGESGTTLRYILPVVAALGRGAVFLGHGRLPSRPLEPLSGELKRHGIVLEGEGSMPLTLKGALKPGAYSLPGSVSSQFIGGLLFALSLLPGVSTLAVTEKFESAAYVRMTLEVLENSGVEISEAAGPEGLPVWTVTGRGTLAAPEDATVEGDWSNAAFWLAAGAIAGSENPEGIRMTGLNAKSLQGDRGVLEILERFGARIEVTDDAILAAPGPNGLKGFTINAAQIPDLVPILAVVAAASEGVTRFTHAERLRIKESDRLKTTSALLAALGVPYVELRDELVVHGVGSTKNFRGSRVSGFGDHRIVMAAAVAAAFGSEPLLIEGAQASAKSYPKFFEDFRQLGGSAKEV